MRLRRRISLSAAARTSGGKSLARRRIDTSARSSSFVVFFCFCLGRGGGIGIGIGVGVCFVRCVVVLGRGIGGMGARRSEWHGWLEDMTPRPQTLTLTPVSSPHTHTHIYIYLHPPERTHTHTHTYIYIYMSTDLSPILIRLPKLVLDGTQLLPEVILALLRGDLA
jgi:hypothetical protein